MREKSLILFCSLMVPVINQGRDTNFSNKRKMINKPLSKTFKEYKNIARKLNLNLNSRPSELSSDDYYRLTEFYEKFN